MCLMDSISSEVTATIVSVNPSVNESAGAVEICVALSSLPRSVIVGVDLSTSPLSADGKCQFRTASV